MFAQVCMVITLVSSSVLAGVLQPALVRQAEPVDLYPRYDYSYSIRDAVTGDAKTQRESRDGENVRGEYSLVEPDGTLRIVTYTAGVEGFNAVVNRQAGFAPPAPVFVRKQPIAYAPQYALALAPAATVAHATIARPLAIRKRVVYKTLPGQFKYPAFQNQLIGSYPQHIVAPPVNFVQHQPIMPVQQQVIVPAQPQPEIVVSQPQPAPAQPAPVPVQPQPQPAPAQPHPQPPQQIPAFPEPQPAPAQPQPQPPPQQIPTFPQPQPQPAPAQPQPQPQPAFPRPVQQRPSNADFDTVEVEAAPRSAANPNFSRRVPNAAGPAQDGSSFTYTSRGNQYDFSVAY